MVVGSPGSGFGDFQEPSLARLGVLEEPLGIQDHCKHVGTTWCCSIKYIRNLKVKQ